MTRFVRAIPPRHSVWAVIGGIVALGVWVWQPWQPSARETAAAARLPLETPLTTEHYGGKEPVLDPVIDQRSQLLGQWVDEFYGRRTFTFKDDGTATMVLELDQVGKLLYGPKLTFFVKWRLEGDTLHLTMAGGEPEASTKTLSKLFGESSQQRIEHIDANEMQLRSLDSQKLYTHKRVADAIDSSLR